MQIMKLSGLGRFSTSPTCCENCQCPDYCDGCPSAKKTRAAQARFATMQRGPWMMRNNLRGMGGVTDTITAHPIIFALGLATVGLMAFAATRPARRHARR